MSIGVKHSRLCSCSISLYAASSPLLPNFFSPLSSKYCCANPSTSSSPRLVTPLLMSVMIYVITTARSSRRVILHLWQYYCMYCTIYCMYCTIYCMFDMLILWVTLYILYLFVIIVQNVTINCIIVVLGHNFTNSIS